MKKTWSDFLGAASFIVGTFVLSMLMWASLILAAIFFGEVKVNVEERPKGRAYEQVCKTCGTVWIVTPKEGAEENPVVEWCFNDGEFCEEGFEMITRDGENTGAELEFLNHCLKCKGCRQAAFQPEDWKKITDGIKKIRSQ